VRLYLNVPENKKEYRKNILKRDVTKSAILRHNETATGEEMKQKGLRREGTS